MIISCIYKKWLEYTICILLFLIIDNNKAVGQNFDTKKIDSLKKIISINKDNKVSFFKIADEYMEANQYDSAQIWLSKIADIVPIQQPTLNSYFLLSRQAEVYYYNGLIRLGLQESYKALQVAKLLNDSLLLADAYNFIGLFYVNLDSNKTAINNFRNGISFVKKPPYPSQYMGLTLPHHLYGNMAEAYTKIGFYDTAIVCAKTSLKLASQIHWNRGIAIALNNIGDNYFYLKQQDSAITNFYTSISISKNENDYDVQLLNYGYLAKTYLSIRNNIAATAVLDSGFILLNKYPNTNSLFSNHFLDEAIAVYKSIHLTKQLANTLELKNTFVNKQIISNNKQMGVILNASLLNETRLLNLQVEQAKQQNSIAKTRLYYLSALFLIGVIAFIFYRYAIIQKLQKSRLRNKISKDLHDDVGSSLSSLNVYSTVATNFLETNPSKAKEMLQKISTQSIELMENIGDIVWSMKSNKEETVSLSTKIKNFTADVLSAAEINYIIDVDESDELLVKSLTARRNILMIIKEAINNAVKYSHASNIIIRLKKTNNTFSIFIKDDGNGFEVDSKRTSGNGLTNMQKRASELNGTVNIQSTVAKGTTITAFFPLAALNNVGW